jgi:hypothetical protein
MIVFVFDWDNTLMASHHHQETSQKGLVSNYTELAQSIKSILDKAQKAGKTYIITNAQKSWVKMCIDLYLPGCEDIYNTVDIISTVDDGFSVDTHISLWKTKAFESMWKKLPGEEEHQLISFGDCRFDRQAAIHINNMYNNSVVKNVFFCQQPSLEQLVRQQDLISKCFEYLLVHRLPLSERKQGSMELDLMLTISFYGNDSGDTMQKSSSEPTSMNLPSNPVGDTIGVTV